VCDTNKKQKERLAQQKGNKKKQITFKEVLLVRYG